VDFVTSREQLRAINTLGDLPVVVLASGVFLREAPTRPEAGPRLHEIWQDLQRDLASLSTNGAYGVVEDSGHFIQRDQPEVVIDAIRRVLDGAPRRSPGAPLCRKAPPITGRCPSENALKAK
jgi:hypothetical protein